MFDAAAALGEKEAKDRLPEVLALLASFYRDALAVAVGADDLVLLRQRGPEVERVGRGALASLQRALRAVLEAEEALLANVNAVTALERLLMEMRACERQATA
jgi:hypothetical protein